MKRRDFIKKTWRPAPLIIPIIRKKLMNWEIIEVGIRREISLDIFVFSL